MSSTVIGMLLAVGGAIALNGGYLIQHVGSSDAIAIDVRRPLATFASLLRSPVWMLGATTAFAGWMLHIAAMREAPLSLVQACLAGGLALAAPMAAVGLRERLVRHETRALGVMALALVLLSLGLSTHVGVTTFSAPALAGWMAVLAAAAVVIASRAKGARRPMALGAAGGLLYGAADLAMKAVTGLHGAGSILTSPWLAACLVVTFGAFFSFQRGLQTGRPLTVIATMTAATNISSILGAFVVFGDPLGKTPQLAALHALAFVLVVAAAWWLAPTQARLARLREARVPALAD